MAKKFVSCGFSEAELRQFDSLVEQHVFTSRSDAIRMCAVESLARRYNARNENE